MAYSWFIIIFSSFTVAVVHSVQSVCMPVLFNSISRDLGLNLVQLGTVWGMLGLAGIFTTLPGGLIGDRYGTKRTLTIFCILAGIFGAMRGISDSFIELSATMFMFGLLTRAVMLNVHKNASVWFSGRDVVIANGIVATGVGIGFMVGAMISDTYLSPLLGGWKNVLFLYGAVSVFIGLIWYFTRPEPIRTSEIKEKNRISFKDGLSRVLKIKEVWFLALAQTCFAGANAGFSGYLPMYLRSSGWSAAAADGALAASNAAGVIGAIPLSVLSGRLHSKRAIMIPSLIIVMVSLCLLPIAEGPWAWLLIILICSVRDGYVAVLLTVVMELEDVGSAYAGTASGIIMTLGALGNFIAPPVGNSFAAIFQGLPFIFWGVIIIVPLIILRNIQEKK